MSTDFRTSRKFGRSQSARPTLTQKSMGVRPMLKEGMAVEPVLERFPELKHLLENGIFTETTVVSVVDLSPFSSFVAASSAEEIRGLLQGYYEDVVSVVEKYGGVVEKYVGDGVVSLFGAPFNGKLNSNAGDISNAFDASRELIDLIFDRFDGELLAKCALDVGPCFVGYVGPNNHSELTVVGNPLTCLARLEEIAPREAVVLKASLFQIIEDRLLIAPPEREHLAEWVARPSNVTLRGVGTHVDITTCLRRRL